MGSHRDNDGGCPIAETHDPPDPGHSTSHFYFFQFFATLSVGSPLLACPGARRDGKAGGNGGGHDRLPLPLPNAVLTSLNFYAILVTASRL